MLLGGGAITGVAGGVVVEASGEVAAVGDKFLARLRHLPWIQIGLEEGGGLVGVVGGVTSGDDCWWP